MTESIYKEPAVMAPLNLLTAAHFRPFLEKEFIVTFSSDVVVCARLVQVLESTPGVDLERKSFSILLQTNLKNTWYGQAIYTLYHEALGALSVFLVPVGKTEEGVQYEAVFA